MNANVTIQHCKLHFVRRGGWGWGADHRMLIQRTVQLLPELIAQRIAQLAPQDAVVNITQPLRINISMSRAELLQATVESARTADCGSVANSIVGRRLAAAVERAVKPHLAVSRPANAEMTGDDGGPMNKAPTNTAHSADQLTRRRDSISKSTARDLDGLAPANRLLRLLLQWLRDGELGLYLKSFSHPTIDVWHTVLFPASGSRQARPTERSSRTDTGDDDARNEANIRDLVIQTVGKLRNPTADRRTRLTSRILVAVEVTNQLDLAPGDERLRRALDDLLPTDDRSSVRPVARDSSNGNRFEANSRQSLAETERSSAEDDSARQKAKTVGSSALPPESRPRSSFLRAGHRDMHVESALPFLLLGPLTEIGYLRTVDAALSATQRADDMPLFAAALAYKVLTPPADGSQRTSEAIATAAAAFAGLETLPLRQDLTDAADEIVSPLNAVLARAVMKGRDPQRPLLLTAVESNQDSGLLLTDIDGLFPIAWAADLDGLADTLQQAETALLLIDAQSADPALLADLDQQGYRFITDALPARGERWRMIQRGPTHRWLTNDRSERESALGRSALELASAAEVVERIWNEFAMLRPTPVKANDRALDHALTLAAAVALSQVAWTLWNERERTDPLLPLERFADLDARVRFDDETVRVTLPLGRRSLDLAEHGLLADVHNVPWLAGRVVTFSKG